MPSRTFRTLALLSAVLTLTSCEGDVGPTGPAGTAGATGPSGPAGPAGPAGSTGLSGWQMVTQALTVPGESNFTSRVECPAGKRVLSGGFAYAPDGEQPSWVFQSFPSSESSWTVSFHNNHSRARQASVYAICANGS